MALHLVWSVPPGAFEGGPGPAQLHSRQAVLSLAACDDPAVGFALLAAADPGGPGAPGPVRRRLEAGLSRLPVLPLPAVSVPPAARAQVLLAAAGGAAGLDLGEPEAAGGVHVDLEHVRQGRSGRVWARVLGPDGRPALEIGGRLPRKSRALVPFRMPLVGTSTWGSAFLHGPHRVGLAAGLDLRIGPSATALAARAEALGLHRRRPVGVVWTPGAVIDLEPR